jgi:hypothetical protein
MPALCAAAVAGQYPAIIKLNPLPGKDTPASDIPQTFSVRRCSVMACGNHGVSERRECSAMGPLDEHAPLEFETILHRIVGDIIRLAEI